ncbi:hypothetical protein H671_3g9413 [Cricetulus griseus]|uniref:Uncharacterized protein n=1 Tax=Cricetulus griseus TaxID=10029 RepID=A0A061IDN3_CRIGR|nr:hypothetical protein H671_3g9413 [Cricetulus griseus]
MLAPAISFTLYSPQQSSLTQSSRAHSGASICITGFGSFSSQTRLLSLLLGTIQDHLPSSDTVPFHITHQ